MDGKDIETMKGGVRASMSRTRRDASTKEKELCNGEPIGNDGVESHER